MNEHITCPLCGLIYNLPDLKHPYRHSCPYCDADVSKRDGVWIADYSRVKVDKVEYLALERAANGQD